MSALYLIISVASTIKYAFIDAEEGHEEDVNRLLTDFGQSVEEITYIVFQKAMDARNPDLPFILGVLNMLPEPPKHIQMMYKKHANWTDPQRRIAFYTVASEFLAIHKETEMASDFTKKRDMLTWLSNNSKSHSLAMEDIGQMRCQEFCSLIKHLIASEDLDLDAIIEFCKIFNLESDDVLVIYLNHLFLGKGVERFSTSKEMLEGAVSSLLLKAENTIAAVENKELLLRTLKAILQMVNPYYYELLLFLHEKVKEITTAMEIELDETYTKGISLLKFIMMYIRVSPPAEPETDHWLAENAGQELPALAESRLPFHPLARGSGHKIINQELTVTTAPVWLEVAPILKLKHDELMVIAIQNTVSKYISQTKNSRITNTINYAPDLTLFANLKELLQKVKNPELSVACASRVTSRLPPGANKVLAAEATALLAGQYASSCKEKKVLDMAKKMSHSYQQLSVELILHKNGLFGDGTQPMMSHPKQLITYLIENCCVPAMKSNKVFEATQQIGEIFEIDLSDMYFSQLCDWLLPVPINIPSNDESFITCGQGDILDPSDDAEQKNMKKAICFLLGLPNNWMVGLLESLSKKFASRSTAHRARFMCCLVAVTNSDLAASITGQKNYSDLLENSRQLMCAAEMSSLCLPYTVDMFNRCNKLELVEQILMNHARGRKVLMFCMRMCLEFKILNPRVWLVILQKLLEMCMVEDLQGVLFSPVGCLPILWNNKTVIKAWNCIISCLFEKGCDDEANKEIIKKIYISLLRCPCLLDASTFPEKFRGSGLLPKDVFGKEATTICSIILILSKVISGEVETEKENLRETDKRVIPVTNFLHLGTGNLIYVPDMDIQDMNI